MADIDDSAAVGAEKSPRKVGGFIAAALVFVVLLLALTMLIVHHSAK